MSNMKSLAKDTAIYGISSIVGKFLNWMLVPLYTYVLKETSDYGIVTHLYAWTALLLVILTYGMETGYFRFANKEGYNPKQVYRTTYFTLLTSSTLFALCSIFLGKPIAGLMGYAGHEEFVTLLGVVVAMDAFASIPFAHLRYQKRPILFATLKLLFVGLNIAFNLFFLIVCPKISDWSIIGSWYNPDYGVGYVFVSNILATAIQTLCLLPLTLPARGKENRASMHVLKEMLGYSLPLLIFGVAGIMNQTLDRIIFPYLYTAEDAQAQLGIYGACFKVAMVMMMFTQAFRYAYEPFVFSKHKDRQSVEAYADAMKYYIIFSLLILLIMTAYLDIFRYMISPVYWEGLKIVPIVLWTYVFNGVFFNLSFWYKLTDQTKWGAYFSLIGLAITFTLQVVFVPRVGYMASAFSSTVCYFVIMLLSYFIGRKHLAIPYDLRCIGKYVALTLVLLAVYYGAAHWIAGTWAHLGVGTAVLLCYMTYMVRHDFPLSALPVVGKYFRKKEQTK